MTDAQDPRPGDLVDGGRSRIETDSMGPIAVPADRLWGAQTQRSLLHFSIGDDRMPIGVHRAYGLVKKAAARINAADGLLEPRIATLIEAAADEVSSGALDAEFPLFVWQTGSGTQSNMNVNEVIANRAILLAGGRPGTKDPVHPNDHVNMSQSSNDTFPTAMHIATVLELTGHLLPSMDALADALWAKAVEWVDVVKIGRTHLQDAAPLTVGQEWSGYVASLRGAVDRVRASMTGLLELAIGGSAVGTGLNTPPRFGERVAAEISAATGHPFVRAPNLFAALASLDAMIATSAALRGLAVSLLKIANDLRWLGSGPRTGFHELVLPANEPGSSIMPGKVNPTQEEAMIMVCIQVIGLDTAVAFAGTMGNFELNVMRPLVIENVLHASTILADSADKLRRYGIEGITLDRDRIDRHVADSLMLVTALAPVIGYDRAAAIAHHATTASLSLRDAALASGVDAEEFDRIVVPAAMVGDPHADLHLN